MSDAWTINENKLTIKAKGTTNVKTYQRAITIEDINCECRAIGIKEFFVFDESDVKLNKNQFPYAGNVVVKEENVAKYCRV